MKSFLGSTYAKTKAFLGSAYQHAPNIHRGVSLGLKIGSAIRPLLNRHGHRSRQISNLIGEADTKYHRISDKVENFYHRNKHNIDGLMN
jgi:hypothetical protein